MDISKNKFLELKELISHLDEDRAWLLKQLDQGSWPEKRLDLASLERELGQVLIRAKEKLEDRKMG